MTTDQKEWWLKAAEGDRRAFETLRRDKNLPAAVFPLQQAAEKFLKALCLHRGRPVFTHSCVELLRKIDFMGPAVPKDVASAARRLDPHYIMARHPNGVGGPPEDFYDDRIVQDLESCCRILMSFVESRLAEPTG